MQVYFFNQKKKKKKENEESEYFIFKSRGRCIALRLKEIESEWRTQAF